jgi:hypothetical protein
MTKEEATNLSSEKAFLHMEVRLNQVLEETEKKYGEVVSGSVAHLIRLNLQMIMMADHIPSNVLLCAWIETIARWNEQIDEFVRK